MEELNLDIFEYQDIKINYPDLIKSLKENTFTKYYVTRKRDFFVIRFRDIPVCIFPKKIEVTINFKDKSRNPQIFYIHSSIDLEKICKYKNININYLYIENCFYKPSNPTLIIQYINNYKITFQLKENEKLSETKKIKIFLLNEEYKVKDYSSFYQDYFYEDIDPDSKFKYIENDVRKTIYNNLNIVLFEKVKTFKFTGPFSIGKSITLLQFCRTTENAFYLNLKIIKEKGLKDSYLILREEFSNMLGKNYDKVQNFIEILYNYSTPPLEAIIKIMDLFSEFEECNGYLFVLDQYKRKYLNINLNKRLEELNQILRIVYCSSINDDIIRKQCLESWEIGIGTTLKESNQIYYFYYGEIYEILLEDEKYPFYKELKGISKYKKYCMDSDLTKEEIKEKIIEKISKKLKEFCEIMNYSLGFLLMNLKNIINKKYKLDKLNEVMHYCPLKFFVVKFYENEFFKIKKRFPFLKYIINRKIKDEEVNNYFKDEKYLKNSIVNESVKGDYFELAVKLGLNHNIKLPQKIDGTVILKEIIKMESVGESDSSEDSEDSKQLSDQNEEKEEEENNDDINEDDDNNIVKEMINKEEDNSATINEDKKIEKSDDLNEKEKREMYDIKKNKLETLLKNYHININKKINNKYPIETYRKAEIFRIKKNINKKDFHLDIHNFNGDKNYFIDQSKKQGRILDYALLYGNKLNKIFVGFQIKCYFNSTKSIDKKFINKIEIAKRCQQILFNSMTMFNCKITEWHYFLIFYYNKKDQQFNVNESIINKCKGAVELLFYEPIDKEFYTIKDGEKILINELILNDNSNLDKHFVTNSMDCLDINKLFMKKDTPLIYNKEEIKNSFIKDFKFLNLDSLGDILKKIAKLMGIEGGLEICHKLNAFEMDLLPDKQKVFLYKRKQVGFLGALSKFKGKSFEDSYYYDLYEKKSINLSEFHDLVDKKFNYLYSLKIKRNYNNFEDESSAKITKTTASLKYK